MKKEDFPIHLQDKIELIETLDSKIKHTRREIFKEKMIFLIKNKKMYLVKKLLSRVAIVCFFVFSGYLLVYLTPEPLILEKERLIYIDHSAGTYKQFLDKIAHYESRGSYNPQPENPNYYGKYQIGPAALQTIGMPIAKNTFIKSPLLQEEAMRLLLLFNKEQLATYIGKYQFKKIKGIVVTESGILAASHLGGSGNVVKFLTTNGEQDFKDGNGTPVSKYLKELSSYQLDLQPVLVKN